MAQKLCDRVAIISKGELITNKPMEALLGLFNQDHYEIKVKGILKENLIKIFKGFKITKNGNKSVIMGPILTQEVLFDHLKNLYNNDLQLISVTPVEPDLEEVFMKLTKEN